MAFADHWEIEDPKDLSELWQKLIGSSAENHVETTQQVDAILGSIPPRLTGRALEVGAGVGRLMRAIHRRQHFAEVHGIDTSVTMVTLGQRYVEGMPLVISDGITIPYPDAYFDFVYSFTVFQHMMTLAIIHRNLAEIRRVLVPGGLCRVQTVASGATDPRNLLKFDGRVFHNADDFAEQFERVGFTAIGKDSGLTNENHIWITACKD